MRTLVVIHSLKLGGMERVAVNLADAFAGEGHDSHLMTLRNLSSELLPSEPSVRLHRHPQVHRLLLSGLGIPVFLFSRLFLGVLVKGSHYLWTGWLSGWLFARHVRAIERQYGRFDRIIFRGIGTYKYLWSFRDPRAIYVLENILHKNLPPWHRRLRARLLFQGRHLAAVSRGVEDSARAHFTETGVTPASLRVITNPCPVEQIRRDCLAPLEGIPSQPYLLNVARLVPQKGHLRLIEAYAEADPEELLVIVGEGPEREKLQRRIDELGLDQRILLVGAQSNPYPWMRQARLFVLSSEYEGLGIVLLEALACGTPVVSVDCPGGVRDLFRGELEAFLAPFSASGLARTLKELLASPLPEPREHWLDGFRSEDVVSRFLSDPETREETALTGD